MKTRITELCGIEHPIVSAVWDRSTRINSVSTHDARRFADNASQTIDRPFNIIA
jgi:hypothetical protein